MTTCSKEGELCEKKYVNHKHKDKPSQVLESKYSTYLHVAQFDVPYRDIHQGVVVLESLLQKNDIVVSFDTTNFFQILNEINKNGEMYKGIFIAMPLYSSLVGQRFPLKTENKKETFETMTGKYANIYSKFFYESKDTKESKKQSTKDSPYWSHQGVAIYYNPSKVQYNGAFLEFMNDKKDETLQHIPTTHVDLYLHTLYYHTSAFVKNDLLFYLTTQANMLPQSVKKDEMKKYMERIMEFCPRVIVMSQTRDFKDMNQWDRFWSEDMHMTKDLPNFYETLTLTEDKGNIQVYFGNARGIYHNNEYVRAVGQFYEQNEYKFQKYTPLLRKHIINEGDNLSKLLTEVHLEETKEAQKRYESETNVPVKPATVETKKTEEEEMLFQEKLTKNCLFHRILHESYTVKNHGGITPPIANVFVLNPIAA